MTELVPKPNGHPIKLVRDNTPGVVNTTGEPGQLFYGTIPDDEERLRWLKLKLGEEVAEFLVDGGADELCDVYAVVRGLGYCFGLGMSGLEDSLDEDDRGGFFEGMMMYGHHSEFDGVPSGT